MPATYPSISALSVTPGFGLNFLKATYSDPNANGGLPGLAVDRIEYWAAATNDRTAAALVDEDLVKGLHVFSDGGARYYWSRPRIREIGPAGERFYGAWFPVSPTGGVAAAATADPSATGFIRLPGGLLLQWGVSVADSSGDIVVEFPTQWTGGQMFRWVGQVAGGTDIDDEYSIKHHTTIHAGSDVILEVKAKKIRDSGGGVLVLEDAANLPIHWFAIGA